jgi:hypothetical protein
VVAVSSPIGNIRARRSKESHHINYLQMGGKEKIDVNL